MINRCHSNALIDFHSTYPNRPKIIHQHSPQYIAINEVCRIQIRIQNILIGISSNSWRARIKQSQTHYWCSASLHLCEPILCPIRPRGRINVDLPCPGLSAPNKDGVGKETSSPVTSCRHCSPALLPSPHALPTRHSMPTVLRSTRPRRPHTLLSL
jgi:hypothetical protein